MNFSGAPANEPSLSKCDPSDELATADLVTKAKYLKLKRRFSALKEVRRSAQLQIKRSPFYYNRFQSGTHISVQTWLSLPIYAKPLLAQLLTRRTIPLHMLLGHAPC